jgi:hypothetical protein
MLFILSMVSIKSLSIHLISSLCCYQNRSFRSIYLVSSQQGKYILPFAFLSQMAAPLNVSWDHTGHLHTNALHWEGFPRLLWESLSLFHYTEPPQYDGVEYREEGVPRC